MRLNSFPVQWLADVPWRKRQIDQEDFANKLYIIADDFILAQDNSLGKYKPKLENAEINI